MKPRICLLNRCGLGAGILLAFFSGAAAGADDTPLAYSADIVTVVDGKTTLSHVASDGVRYKHRNESGDSGMYEDSEAKLRWQWGVGYPCLQMPLGTEKEGATRTEEAAGTDTVAGHPTKKAKVTSTFPPGAQMATRVEYWWRATDLQGLVIRRRSLDGTFEWSLRNIVLGTPDPRELALPSPPCKYDEMEDHTRDAAEPPGGYRTIRFSDASCKQLVPLPLQMSIPSDYAIRSAGLGGCFWGTEDDLQHALAVASEVDYTAIRRGVFRCSVGGADFDPVHGKFVSELGPQENWPAALQSSGVRDVVMEAKTVGGVATLRVSGTLAGRPVYMLYIGFGDSPAILIAYIPPIKGGASDLAEWQHFLHSFQEARRPAGTRQ